MITTIIYISWALYQILFIQIKSSGSLRFLGMALGLSWLGALFELFDFSPIFWIFDSHSIFHLFTIPTPFLWAEFLIRDANFNQRSPQKIRQYFIEKNYQKTV